LKKGQYYEIKVMIYKNTNATKEAWNEDYFGLKEDFETLKDRKKTEIALPSPVLTVLSLKVLPSTKLASRSALNNMLLLVSRTPLCW
jgi:hypothetical protein